MLRKQSLVFSFCLPDHFSKLTLELPGLGILSFSFASRWTASSAAQRYEVELAKTSSLEHVEHAWQRWFLPKVEIILAILLSPKLSSRGYVPWRASFGLSSNIPIASWNVWPWPKIKGEKKESVSTRVWWQWDVPVVRNWHILLSETLSPIWHMPKGACLGQKLKMTIAINWNIKHW